MQEQETKPSGGGFHSVGMYVLAALLLMLTISHTRHGAAIRLTQEVLNSLSVAHAGDTVAAQELTDRVTELERTCKRKHHVNADATPAEIEAVKAEILLEHKGRDWTPEEIEEWKRVFGPRRFEPKTNLDQSQP